MFRSFSSALRIVPFSLLQKSAASSAVVARCAGARHAAGAARQFSCSDSDVIRWSMREMLNWDTSYDLARICQIHGDRDRVFPISCVEPDVTIAGGGHVISITHGPQVNQFLRESMARLTAA